MPKTIGISTKISILFIGNGDIGIEFLSRVFEEHDSHC
jgi:hypothetical protein